MKRITVSVTLNDNYVSSYTLKKIKTAMTNVAVQRCSDDGLEISRLDGKIGHVSDRA